MRDVQVKDELVRELCVFAKKRKLQKLMLFGSRARGDSHPKSDIDLAAQGGDIAGFTDDVNEKAQTLLFFDVIDLDRALPDAFRAEIMKDGVMLYEEIR